MLRKARKNDIERIASIHTQELANEFLPSLGKKFLQKLYNNFLASKFTSIYIFEHNHKIAGFIVGSTNFSQDFKNILLNNWLIYAIILVPQILKNPLILKNIFETLFYTKKENTTTNAELVVIAVDKDNQHQGVGKKLVNSLEKDFRAHKAYMYKVTVGAYNKPANKFYRSVGFQKTHTFKLYNKQLNLYLKQLT